MSGKKSMDFSQTEINNSEGIAVVFCPTTHPD